MKPFTMTVICCARCGGTHYGQEFKPLLQPVIIGDVTMGYWSPCPMTGDPILAEVKPEQPEEK